MKIHGVLLALSAFFLCATSCQQSKQIEGDAQVVALSDATSSLSDDVAYRRQAYFGDLHVHSSWSFDAFIYNVRTSPDDAYRFGKGEEIKHVMAGKIQNRRPLDFMAVTDHAEYMGVMMQMIQPESPLAALDIAKRIRSQDRQESLDAFGEVGQSLARNESITELADRGVMRDTWKRIVEIADRHNEPGKFTTFPAYEWTSSPSRAIQSDHPYAANLHRNVIYRGDKVSDLPFSSFDSQDPEALWRWMAKEQNKGIDLIAIPHNANMSDGLMFGRETYDGRPMDKAYATLRSNSEPINEVVQIKGQSMSHPLLNPNDEFADYEIYAYTFAVGTPPPSRPQGSYVRQALREGLKLEQDLGANPYNFGLIGSSDGHNSAGPVEEGNYFGKLGNIDGTPEIRMRSEGGQRFLRSKYMSAAGLAGVWAQENTRDAIYDAMKRKEVFATSGPRIQVRFFGGEDLSDVDLASEDWTESAYKNGVPMGTNMSTVNEAPYFVVWAVKDPQGANLDRIQVIKQWVDTDGGTHEKIYNVAWSGDRKIDELGDLDPVGNTVNVKEATYENTIGAISLEQIWRDPDYKKGESALYFMRVLEIPTPRWTTYDAKLLGIDIPDDLNATTQERAWSSPIWVK